MVDNVSKRMQVSTAISKYELSPCKICRPPIDNSVTSSFSSRDKSVGACTSVQCSGITKRRTRCKHRLTTSLQRKDRLPQLGKQHLHLHVELEQRR